MSHTSQQFCLKVPPLSLPILHPPTPPCSLLPFTRSLFAIRSPLNLSVLLFLSPSRFCLSVRPSTRFYPSYHAFVLTPFTVLPGAPCPSPPRGDGRSRPGGAAGLVRFMSCVDGRLKGPAGISLCHQRLASTLPANVVGAAASMASAAGINAARKNLYTDAFADTSDVRTRSRFSPPPPKTHHMRI